MFPEETINFDCRMGALEKTSTKIPLNAMKGVLQNWVVGLWKYLSSLIYLGIVFYNSFWKAGELFSSEASYSTFFASLCCNCLLPNSTNVTSMCPPVVLRISC